MENLQIPEEALMKIKNQRELDDFFHDLYKQAVEGMLKAEMEEHLGYAKHQMGDQARDNTRNGYSQKTLKTNIGYPFGKLHVILSWHERGQNYFVGNKLSS